MYKINLERNKIIKVDEEDLELDDIIVVDKIPNVVIDISPLKYIPLGSALNTINQIRFIYDGATIYPSEISKYFTEGDVTHPLNEEAIDRNWGIISCRSDCVKWYERVTTKLDIISDLTRKL